MATTQNRVFKRFESEADAIKWAREQSRNGDELAVLESPPRNEDTGEPIEGGRYVADNMGFIRSWERCIVTYRNGRKV